MMTTYQFIALSPILILIIYVIFRARRRINIRRCAYGNLEVYNLLKTAREYTDLKMLMAESQRSGQRYFVCTSISRLYPMKLLEQWVSDEPESGDALLCYGARLLQWSWSARGYGRGAKVSEKKWKLFFKRLEKLVTY